MVLLLAHTQSILPSRTRWKKKFQNTLPNASIIGACAVSLSTSYAFGDTFKARHSLHYKLSEAKFFYGSYAAIVILAGAIVLIPNAPLGLLTLAVQALAGILLPSATVFLVLLFPLFDELSPDADHVSLSMCSSLQTFYSFLDIF